MPPRELALGDAQLTRVSVFLSVLDVHIVRSPVAGRVSRKRLCAGQIPQCRARQGERGERAARLGRSKRPTGKKFGVMLIAGLIARRIVTFVGEGASVAAGERIGLIRFGSRVDVYLPAGAEVLVAVGQTAIGGETVLAELAACERVRDRRCLVQSELMRDRRPMFPPFDPERDERKPPPARVLPRPSADQGADPQHLHPARALRRARPRSAWPSSTAGISPSRRSCSRPFSTASTAASRGCSRPQSRFGAELDSLADFVNFGVAPAIIMFNWALDDLRSMGWIAVLVFAVCSALRLARFNVALDRTDLPAWKSNYFVGVPAPAGAIILLLPIYAQDLGLHLPSLTPLVLLYTLAIALLMVSQRADLLGQDDRPEDRTRICAAALRARRAVHRLAC